MNWRKSSYSGQGGGNCIEAGNVAGTVAVRDSKQAGLARRDVLAFKPSAWREFTSRLKQS